MRISTLIKELQAFKRKNGDKLVWMQLEDEKHGYVYQRKVTLAVPLTDEVRTNKIVGVVLGSNSFVVFE